MDENNNFNQDIDTEDEITEISEAEADGFDEAWGDAPDSDNDDFDLSDESSHEGGRDESSEEAEPETEPEAEAEPEADETPAEESDDAAEKPKDEPGGDNKQTYTLKSPKGEKQCTFEEVMAYANKGLDYDGLKQDRDRLRGHEDFLKSLAEASNLTVDELIDNTNARIYKDKMQSEGKEVTDFEALHAVQRERASKAAEMAAESSATEEQQKTIMIDAFMKEFPDVKASEIPESVWRKAHETGDLASSYREHVYSEKDAKIAELEAKIKTLETNKKNKERSTGSQKSYGTASRDFFDDGWNSW